MIITQTFRGISFLFPRERRAIREVLDKLSIKYTLDGDTEFASHQVLTIALEENTPPDEIFSMGMLIMQTIMIAKA